MVLTVLGVSCLEVQLGLQSFRVFGLRVLIWGSRFRGSGPGGRLIAVALAHTFDIKVPEQAYYKIDPPPGAPINLLFVVQAPEPQSTVS